MSAYKELTLHFKTTWLPTFTFGVGAIRFILLRASLASPLQSRLSATKLTSPWLDNSARLGTGVPSELLTLDAALVGRCEQLHASQAAKLLALITTRIKWIRPTR